MHRHRLGVWLAAISLVLTGCSDSTEASTTTASLEAGVQRQPETASAFFSFEEVVLGTDGYVTLNNFTSSPVTLDGLHLCQGSDCFALPNETVPPGANAVIAVGSAPSVDGVVVTGANIGDLAPSDGELALYINDPTNRERLIEYLEWGATPHQRTDDAIARGLWIENSFAPSGANAIRLFRNADSGLWLWDAASE